jgi:hypothetical protein
MAIIGIMLCLLAPATAGAQGLKGNDDDPATEESNDDDATAASDTNSCGVVPEDGPQDPEDAGLVDDVTYESPQFGYELSWSEDWELDTYYDPAVVSNEEEELDQICIMWSGGPDEESYAIFAGQTANRGGPENDVEEWTDEDYIADQWAESFESTPIGDDTTRDSGAVLYSVVDTDNDYQYYTLYQSTELADGTTLYITFSGYEDWFEDSYAAFSEEVLLDGDPIELVFDADQISELIAAQ